MPTTIEELIKQGCEYYQDKEYKESLNYYNKALEIDPSHTEVLYQKGQCFYGFGKYEEAIEDYEKILI